MNPANFNIRVVSIGLLPTGTTIPKQAGVSLISSVIMKLTNDHDSKEACDFTAVRFLFVPQ